MDLRSVSLMALDTLPGIVAGSDLCAEILAAAERAAISLASGDIIVVAQKVVSKAEGRYLCLGTVEPSPRACELARQTGKDPRLIEVILAESHEVLRARMNVMIVEHRLGHIMANAGVDRSNLDLPLADDDHVLLLPEDPDRSAALLRQRLEEITGVRLGVVISDSFGRPWRLGTTGTAIGLAGPAAVIDRRGDPDMYGRPLESTEVGFADAIASAAVLVMGEADEGCPVAVVRGLDWSSSQQTSRDVLRPRSEDLFR